MTENMLQSSVLLDKSKQKGSYKFQLPTVATKLDPVFILTFQESNNGLIKSDFKLSLNPKLAITTNLENLERQYCFNDDGDYLFDNEEFDGYFIEGDIKMNEAVNYIDGKSCFLRITYGKKDEALHFIKGNFKLNELIQ